MKVRGDMLQAQKNVVEIGLDGHLEGHRSWWNVPVDAEERHTLMARMEASVGTHPNTIGEALQYYQEYIDQLGPYLDAWTLDLPTGEEGIRSLSLDEVVPVWVAFLRALSPMLTP